MDNIKKQLLEDGIAPKAVSAKAFERAKTREQRAEDIAYTINHSLYCTLTDFINPPINAATDNWLRWLIPGCGHDHSGDAKAAGDSHGAVAIVPHVHGPHCWHTHQAVVEHMCDEWHVAAHVHGPSCGYGNHEHPHAGPPKKSFSLTVIQPEHTHAPKPPHKTVSVHVHTPSVVVPSGAAAGHVCIHGHLHMPANATRWDKVKVATKHAFSKERFVQYAKGEFIGDFGAVPITIGVQRLFPGVMDGLRKLSEPLVRPLFRYGIERDSKSWAYKNTVDTDSAEYKQHVKDVYEHEMKHFPQAIVWTGASLGLNVGYQMYADKTDIPFMKKAALKSGSVLSGVLVTAGMVVAARAFAPHKVRDFDKWTSKNFILPSTKVVGKVFGVDEKAVNRMTETQDTLDHEKWSERVSQIDDRTIIKGAG